MGPTMPAFRVHRCAAPSAPPAASRSMIRRPAGGGHAAGRFNRSSTKLRVQLWRPVARASIEMARPAV